MFRFSKPALAAAAFFALSLAAADSTKAVPIVPITNSALSNATAVINFESGVNVSPNGAQYGSSLTVLGHPVLFTYVGPAGGNNGVGVIAGNGTGAGTNGIEAGNTALTVNVTLGDAFNTNTLNITFDPGASVRSFGFDIKASNATQIPNVSTGSYTVTVVTADSQTYTFSTPALTYNTFSFFGVNDLTSDIVSISVAALAGGQPDIDNFRFTAQAPTATTPEPATMILFGTGLAGVASFARKRRRAAGDQQAA
jgi:hypothetical protein